MKMNEAKLKKLPTAAEYAYDQIREAIVRGELAPNSRINLEELAQNLQMSRVPVRGALDRLCAENLVLDVPRRGMIVMPLSIEHLRSIFVMRVSLEAIAIVEAIENATAKEIENIRGMLAAQPFEPDDIDGVMQNNRDFHFAIFDMSRDETLCRVLESLWAQSNRYRYIFYKQMKLNDRIVAEHRELVEYICNKDKQKSVDLLTRHTWKSYETLTVLLGGAPHNMPIRPVAVEECES